MNLPVIFSKIGSVVKSACGNGLLLARKHAPEIMIGTGIIGFGATIVETVKATNKTNDIIDERDAKEASFALVLSEDDYHEACKSLKRKTRMKIAKAWAPVVTLGAGSVIFVLGGYKIINGRYVATAAAYKVLEAEYDRYRENARDRFGDDVDWELANDIKPDKLEAALAERKENDKIAEANKKKKLKKAPKTAYQEIHSRIFDSHSDRWQRYWNAELLLDFLEKKEDEANDKLILNGHLFENEANDILGLPRTSEGAVCGWIRNKEHPNTKVEFIPGGIKNMPPEEIRRLLGTHRNEDLWVHIKYNVTGLIYNLI